MSGYAKNTWVNQDVERPKTYEVTTNADGSITLTDSFGLVTELGTPVNADNMNHIEDGLTRVSITEYDNTFTYSEDDWVTGIVDGEKTICRSKTDNNTGNALSNDTYWEVLKLGGGGSGYQMFDIVMKDHVLSYEESLGFAPLGTYVYKEAIAGTRYGYPDFYQKCLDEYQDLNNTTDTVDSTTVTINANGHKFYDIADKATFDNIFGITGECWYYGIDTTNERIFLPRSTRFKNGTTSDVGGYQAPGLPNIEGTFYIRSNSDATAGIALTTRPGALYTDIHSTTVTETINSINTSSTNRRPDLIGFDASLSNSIYGASSTVEYSSTKLIPYFVVGNTADWTGMSTVVNQGMDILSQVANKATTDLDNLTNAGKIAIAHNAMPSNVTLPLTLPASDTIMTAPADGYVCLGKLAASSQNIYLSKKSDHGATADLEVSNIAPVNNSHLWAYLPLSKGDKFEVSYTATGTLYRFCFVYANGSESEAS